MTRTTPQVTLRRRLESLVLLALCLAILALLFDWNWFKGPIERRVEAATGRSFTIGGNLDGDIGRVLTLRADGLRLGNAEWSPDRELGEARHVELQVEWRSLLEGDLVIPSFEADHVKLLLERDGRGNDNWVLRDGAGLGVDVRQLTINHGSLHVVERDLGTDFSVAAQSGTRGPNDARAPLLISGSGKFRKAPLSISGTVESPLELAHEERPYHVDLRMRAGATHAHARGELTAPLQLSGYDLALEVSGPNMAQLYPLLGLALPDTPPYRLDGRLHHEHRVWMFREFRGKVGSSDLAGSMRVNAGSERTVLYADLDSRRLDLADLSGFAGVSPGTGKGNGAKEGRVLPAARYDLPKLRAMDAEVKMHAATVVNAPLPVKELEVTLAMSGGVVKLDPLRFGLAGGSVRGHVRYDARTDPLGGEVDLAARDVELPILVPDAKLKDGHIGKVGGAVKLQGRGDSVADLLAHSNGSVRVGMGEGQVSNMLMEKAGIDLAEMLKFKLTGDRLIPIRCGGAEFAVEDGVMSTKNMVFDTSDTRVDGTGTVSLRDETLALKLQVRPKDKSPLALRAPIVVKGTFEDPKFGPEKRVLALRALATGALYTLAPPLMLAGTLEVGGGKDAQCPAPGRYY